MTIELTILISEHEPGRVGMTIAGQPGQDASATETETIVAKAVAQRFSDMNIAGAQAMYAEGKTYHVRIIDMGVSGLLKRIAASTAIFTALETAFIFWVNKDAAGPLRAEIVYWAIVGGAVCTAFYLGAQTVYLLVEKAKEMHMKRRIQSNVSKMRKGIAPWKGRKGKDRKRSKDSDSDNSSGLMYGE